MSSWKSWRIPRITVANQWWHYIEINEWEREEDTCDQGLSQARENRRVGVPLQQNFYLVVSFINFLHTQTWSRKWREIWTIELDEANFKQNQDSSHLTVNRSIGRKFSGRKTCRGRNFTHEETESQIELAELICCHFESLAQSHELQKKNVKLVSKTVLFLDLFYECSLCYLSIFDFVLNDKSIYVFSVSIYPFSEKCFKVELSWQVCFCC